MEQHSNRSRRWALVCLVSIAFAGCGEAERFGNLASLRACDPTSNRFGLEIDNPYFPLPVGQRLVLEGEESGGHLLVRITVLDETEMVGNVVTRVVEEFESIDGNVVEISRNYFAQAEDGTVCYFGEEVDIYGSDGSVTSHQGSWRASGENRPGIFMPPSLRVGAAFQQEVAPGIAEDQAKVVALGERTEVPAGTFEETVTLVDSNPLDGSQGTKVYAEGIGLVIDGPARLTDVMES